MSKSSRLLAPFLRRQWGALAMAMGASVAVAVAELARPFPLSLIIDRLFEAHSDGPFQLTHDDLLLLAVAAAMVLVTALVDAVASYQIDVRLEKAGERIVHDLRMAVYSQLQRLSIGYHERRPTGDLVTRVTGDVNAVGEIFSESLGTVVTSVLLLVGMFVVSLIIDPLLAVVAFAVTPVLAVVTVRFRRRLRSAARHQRAKEGEIASLSTETLAAMREVKALGSERFEEKRMLAKSIERREAGIAAARIEGRFTGVVDVLGAVGTVMVLVVGVFQVAKGKMSPGDLVVMNSYVRRLYRPLRDIARQASRVSRSMARADRICEVLAADQVLADRPGAHHQGRAAGDLELQDVTFSHEADRPVLAGLSFKIPSGEKVAVVGPSGVGKSTLAALVARFYEPVSGAVMIDGRDVRDCSLSWLRDQVGLVLQDTVLFSGTVADNISYGTEADRPSIEAAAKAAGAHAFVTALPIGYDTELGLRGVALSGGQRQRIAIARTLLRDPPVLVLDEPTTGLDVESEAEVVRGLETLMRGRTTVVITHSLALAAGADRVVVLDAGRVVQEGSPQDLLSAEGTFRRLAGLQGLVHLTPTGVGPPVDAALPNLGVLLQPAAMVEVLRRGLLDSHDDIDLRIHCLRYKPGTNVVVHYDVGLAGAWHHAVAMITADGSLAVRAAKPENRALAAQVEGRCPAAPMRYESDIGALVQWLPLDLSLPSLGAPTAELWGWMWAAGVRSSANPPDPVLLHYKPRRRAVLRAGRHVVKIYATDDDFTNAVRGLRTAWALDAVPTAKPRGVVAEARLTVQSALTGSQPGAHVAEVAAAVGPLLNAIHRSEVAGLRSLPPSVQLDAAGASARLVAHVAPELGDRIHRLLAQLEATVPSIDELVPSHGDFHAGQVLEHRGRLSFIDFDEMCLAPAALDPATFAAHLVGGQPGDLNRAAAALGALVDGYGETPDGLAWYLSTSILRRSPFPFRYYGVHWRVQVESMVRASESALSL
ncbi:MAG: ABC transporter transmembrane domain-containing protein [Acidimicrobiales bacterium]